jgi:hypothetical protein
MEEQLLHFIWHRLLFTHTNLVTTNDEPVEILHTGVPNHDQGPDFLQARIRIADQLWAGHVEIHVRSSMWYLHRHEHDTHYNNVILHVVWKEDQPAYTHGHYRIPCIELEGRIDHALMDRYHHLMNNQEWVPCASSLTDVSSLIRTSWLDRLLAERLEYKTAHILQHLNVTGYHWEQVFFVMLARQLGAPANSEAMEELCLKLPWNVMRRHGDRIDQIEAILFGCAGMLEKEWTDEYPSRLKREFDFLKKKYQFPVMPGLRWKFMRMRPVHFPTIRIAQLAKMIFDSTHFIALLEEIESAEKWVERFMVKPMDPYWEDHYHFASHSPKSVKRLGATTANTLVINVVAPVMFLYGKTQGKPALKEHALDLLRELPAEANGIVRGWKTCGWEAHDAGQTQALLHLKKKYCDERRCMHCAVGLKVIK